MKRALLLFIVLQVGAVFAHQPCEKSLSSVPADPALNADERGLLEGVLKLALMVLPPENAVPYDGGRQLDLNDIYFHNLVARYEDGLSILHATELTAYNQLREMCGVLVMGTGMTCRRSRLGAHVRGLELAVQIMERKHMYGRRLVIAKLGVELGRLVQSHWHDAEGDGQHLPPPLWAESEELSQAMRLIRSMQAMIYMR